MQCLFGGKGLPARKLVAMIAYRCVRDPREADFTAEREFEGVVMQGHTVDEGIAFFDRMLHTLAATREGLISADKVERKVLAALSLIRDPRMRDELTIYHNLFPGDRYKDWQYFPAILRRLQRSSVTAAITAADAAASQPVPAAAIPKKIPPPALALTTDGSTVIVGL